MSDVFRKMSEMFNGVYNIIVLTLVIAVVTSIAAASHKPSGGKRVVRAKSGSEAVNEALNHDGWVLLTVDGDKCGYCETAKIMLDARGIPYKEVNITDVPENELDVIVEKLGIEHVPVLILVRDGKVILVKHFEGKKEKDIEWVRRIEAY